MKKERGEREKKYINETLLLGGEAEHKKRNNKLMVTYGRQSRETERRSHREEAWPSRDP